MYWCEAAKLLVSNLNIIYLPAPTILKRIDCSKCSGVEGHE